MRPCFGAIIHIAFSVDKATIVSLECSFAIREGEYYGNFETVHLRRLPTGIVCIVVENAVTIAIVISTFTYKTSIVIVIVFAFDFRFDCA
jgi:hypothetical protein